jgi:hypothetical protein
VRKSSVVLKRSFRCREMVVKVGDSHTALYIIKRWKAVSRSLGVGNRTGVTVSSFDDLLIYFYFYEPEIRYLSGVVVTLFLPKE